MDTLSEPRYKMRSSFRGGAEARRHAVHAWRKFFKYAVAAGHCSKNPASAIRLPRKSSSRRRGLTREEVEKLFDLISTTGNDPELDVLIFRTALETGCRRGGLLGLTKDRVDEKRQTVTVLEKGGRERELPVSRSLVDALLQHNHQRGGSKGALLRYLDSTPLTQRRLDYLFARVKEAPPFPGAELVSMHWLRHTAGTFIERASGSSEAIAANYLGHEPTRSSVTGLYTTAPLMEMVRVWCSVWNCDHPLAHE